MAERIHCKVTLGSTSERFSVPYTPPSPIASLVSASLEAFNLQHAPSIKFGLIDQDGDKLQL